MNWWYKHIEFNSSVITPDIPLKTCFDQRYSNGLTHAYIRLHTYISYVAETVNIFSIYVIVIAILVYCK